MQILSLDLENAKSYENAKIDFTLGVNAIVGPNGAGKSTILESIGFAVFDALDYRQEDFIRGGSKSAQVTVTIASSVDERVYQVVRRIGSSTQYYIFDPELSLRICEGKADVLTFLREHLDVEPGTNLEALFRDAVGVPQGTFTAAFLETPARRKPIFDSLLQVEEYQRAYERLREPISRLRERRNELSIEISGLSARLERLPMLRQSVEVRTEQIQRSQADLETKRGQLTKELQKREQLEEQREKLVDLRNRHQQATQQVDNATHQLQEARKALQSAKQARDELTAAQPGYEAYREAQVRQQELATQAQARQQIFDQRSQIEREAAIRGSELKELQRALADVVGAEKRVQELQPAVARQQELEIELLQASQQAARQEELQKSLAQQRAHLTTLCQRQESLSEQLAKAAALEKRRMGLEQEMPPLRTEMEEARASLAAFTVEAETLKEQTQKLDDAESGALCPVCEQELTDKHRKDLVTRNQSRLADLRDKYSERQREIRERQTVLEEKATDLEQLRDEAHALPRPAEKDQVDKEVEAARASIASLERDVGQLEDVAKRVKGIEGDLQKLNNPRRQYDVAQETASRRAKTETAIQRAETENQQLTAKLAAIIEQLAKFEGLDDKIESTQTALQTHTAAHQRYLANEQAAASLDVRAATVEQQNELMQALVTERDRLAKELGDAESQYEEKEYRSVVAREQELRGVIGGLETQSSLLVEAQEHEQSEIASLQKDEEALQDKVAQVARLDSQHDVLSLIRDLIRRAGPYITSALIRQISEGASQTFSEIMQDHSRHLVWGEDYGISVEVDGHQRQFSQLSGGEQMSAALAVRLALLREMSAIDVAFFDEPTANLDETRRDQLARQILQVKGFRQIFVISHDDTFEQATQNVIRVERVDSTSRVEFA